MWSSLEDQKYLDSLYFDKITRRTWTSHEDQMFLDGLCFSKITRNTWTSTEDEIFLNQLNFHSEESINSTWPTLNSTLESFCHGCRGSLPMSGCNYLNDSSTTFDISTQEKCLGLHCQYSKSLVVSDPPLRCSTPIRDSLEFCGPPLRCSTPKSESLEFYDPPLRCSTPIRDSFIHEKRDSGVLNTKHRIKYRYKYCYIVKIFNQWFTEKEILEYFWNMWSTSDEKYSKRNPFNQKNKSPIGYICENKQRRLVLRTY